VSDWRCTACKTLLGKITAAGEIEIQYKGVTYRVKGQVNTHCRRCRAPASRSTQQ
jgi:hypothetical protein